MGRRSETGGAPRGAHHRHRRPRLPHRPLRAPGDRHGCRSPTAGTPGSPAPQKKTAGRDLGAAIGVGVGLGAVIVASLF
ncbi:hypothetical protein ACWC8S_35850, partial [Streptomyces fungicidicus]